MITESQLNKKYPKNTPWYRKDPIEYYICDKHNQPAIFIRDADVIVHGDLSETECY